MKLALLLQEAPTR